MNCLFSSQNLVSCINQLNFVSFDFRFANKKAYVALYGLLGCIYSASYAYFHGTITTMEKRFKIPSRTTGYLIFYLLHLLEGRAT